MPSQTPIRPGQAEAFNQQSVSSIELRNLRGLSLKADIMNRPPVSWQQLDDMDLFVDGSVRNVLGWQAYGVGPAGAPYEAIFEYRLNDHSPTQIWGYCGTTATLWRLDASGGPVPLAVPFMPGATPWIGLFPGIKIPYQMVIWDDASPYSVGQAVTKQAPDGKTYIYVVTQAGTSGANEPTWPVSGSVSDSAVGVQWATDVGAHTPDGTGTLVWINRGQPSWAPRYPFVVGDLIMDTSPTRNIQEVASSGGGASSIGPPVWGKTLGAIAFDNLLRWSCQLRPAWQPGLAYSVGAIIVDPHGNLQQVLTTGASGPAPGTAVVWTNQGLLTESSFSTNYAVLVCAGGPVQKFDGSVVTLVGVQAPTIQAQVTGTESTVVGALGVAIQFGRLYAWTWFNPNTLAESSPSPLTGPVSFYATDTGAVITSQGCLLPPSATGAVYTSVFVGLPPAATLNAPVPGDGFTNVRFYATRDGGSVLYLLQTMYDASGSVITDANSSVPITSLSPRTGYLPLPITQAKTTLMGAYDGTGTATSAVHADASLVLPGPAFGDNDPPPVNPMWATTYQGSLYVADTDNRIRLDYSQPESFEAFGVNNFLLFPDETDSSITALIGTVDRLIVGTTRGLQQVVGSSPASFARYPIDRYHGIVGKQVAVASGSQLIALIAQGIVSVNMALSSVQEPSTDHVSLGFSPLSLIGNDVQPITDALDPAGYAELDAAIYDTTANRVLFLLRSVGASVVAGSDQMLGLQIGVGFNRFATLPGTGELRCLKEVQDPVSGRLAILGSDTNGQIWRLVAGYTFGAVTPSVPVSRTQSLPTPEQVGVELRDTQKTFSYLWVEGTNLGDYTLEWSLDGSATFKPEMPQTLRAGLNRVGATGRQIVFRFKRVGVVPRYSLMSYYKLFWDVQGKVAV